MKNKELKKVLTYLFLGIFGIVMLFPVIWMFFACFKTNNEIFGSLRILPQGWSMELSSRAGRPQAPTRMPNTLSTPLRW